MKLYSYLKLLNIFICGHYGTGSHLRRRQGEHIHVRDLVAVLSEDLLHSLVLWVSSGWSPNSSSWPKWLGRHWPVMSLVPPVPGGSQPLQEDRAGGQGSAAPPLLRQEIRCEEQALP